MSSPAMEEGATPTTTHDDEAALAALEALESVMTALSSPGAEFNRELHQTHLELAASAGLEDQVTTARTMMVQSVACGDDVWLPLLQDKTAKADATSAADLAEVLDLHDQSVEDYLSISLLVARVRFVLHHWYRVQEAEDDEDKKEMLEDVAALFTEAKVRVVLSDSASRASANIAESHYVWDLFRDWELSLLEKAPEHELPARLPKVTKFFLDRLRATHSTLDATFQAYTSFVSTYANEEYEVRMIAATKAKGEGAAKWSKRERWEDQLVAPGAHPPSIFPSYIAWELKPKKPELILIQGLYARAIADAAARGPFDAEPFWISLMSFLNTHLKIERVLLENAFKGIRSVSGSGELWAAYIRALEYYEKPAEQIDGIYRSALGSGVLHSRGVDDAVKIVMARLSNERRLVESSRAEDDALINLFMEGLEFVNGGPAGADPAFRIEKYLISWYERTERHNEAAIVWESLSKSLPTSYLVWTQWAEFEIRRLALPKAREVFKSALKSAVSLDWPEAIFDASITFEQQFGTIETLDLAMDKVSKCTDAVNLKRHKEAKAAARSGQYEAASVAVKPTQATEEAGAPAVETADNEKKRKAEKPEESTQKKQKQEPAEKKPIHTPASLARDREHSTVFVGQLPADTSEETLQALFTDCGEIREIKLPQREGSLFGTVEFMNRESVPPALTKDKKIVNNAEIEVSVAWQSTIYITNFPATLDDASLRAMFEPYGPIFETRWPGKKFKVTRRFVYLQYLSPSSAKAALELNGRELEPGHKLTVAISDPERKKERTDKAATEREVVVSQMSKFVTKQDLERVFAKFGRIKDVRMTLDAEGRAKGVAFIEFEEESAAKEALSMNNFELKKRRLAVTVPDVRGSAYRKMDIEKCVHVGSLPPGTQEGLLQQVFEKISPVSRVQVFEKSNEALVELDTVEAVGALLLAHSTLVFNEHVLPLLAGTQRSPAKGSGAVPIPVAAASADDGSSSSTIFRPPPRRKSKASRIGTGERRAPAPAFVKAEITGGGGDVEMGNDARATKPSAGGGGGGQDKFRAMLNEKREP